MDQNKLRILFLDGNPNQISAVEHELREGKIDYEAKVATNEGGSWKLRS